MEFKDIKFPLLGSTEDGETFEYILWSVNRETIDIAILNWFVKRSKLYANEKVYLYLPKFLSDQYLFRGNLSGTVLFIDALEEMHGEIYHLTIDQIEKIDSMEGFLLQMPRIEEPLELLRQLIKDSMLLKQGIEVYIKHIIPYFSRIVDYTSKEYDQIKKHILFDVEKRVKANFATLKNLYETLQSNLVKSEEIPIYIDLEQLREICESEISKNLFHIIFTKNDFIYYEKNYGFSMYINAIKNLEQRLYSNYNQIVFIYLKSLKLSISQD